MTNKPVLRPCRAALLLLCAASLIGMASCRSGPQGAATDVPAPTEGAWAYAPPGGARAASGFEEPSQPLDPAIYGDLEHLDPAGRIVVYWHPLTGSLQELLYQLVDEFNNANPWQITVIAESLASRSQLDAAIMRGIAAQRTPHLADASADQIAGYAVHGAVVPLDHYVRSSRWGYAAQELGDFFPPALQAGYLPQFGAHYSWPLEQRMDLLYYNADWLAELGYQAPPTTWDELAEMARAAAAQPFSGAKGEGPTLGYAFRPDARTFASHVASMGGDIVNSEGTAYVFDSPQGLATLSLLRDLTERGAAAALTGTDPQHAFGAGHVLFALDRLSLLSAYEHAVDGGGGFGWGVQPPPRRADPDAARISLVGRGFVVFKGAPEDQLAAWLFVKWMAEPEQQARWAAATGNLPNRRSTYGLLTSHFAANPAYQQAFRLLSLDYTTAPAVAGYGRCSAAMEQMVSRALSGHDAQGELSIAVNACNIALGEALR